MNERLALESGSPAYQIFMLALCIFALLIFAFEAVFRGDAEVLRLLRWADNFVCVIFLADFALTFARAPNKMRYLLTWGWLDLLSAIPTLDPARWGRLARIARLTRVLRALRASRLLGRMLFRQRKQSAMLAAALVALFLIVGSSAAILRFEDHGDANIKTANDAVWWAFTTITTVGYGDRFPVTAEGRIIAAILMTAGVGLFGAFSAAVAAWFLAPEDEATDEELAALRGEIATLRALVEDRLPNRAP
jgi:voltage-gated potassium channel